jgi:hypothetical protein
MNPARNSELTAAIEQLYTVFANYRPSAIPQFCSHCVTAEEDALLRSRPLRELTGKELARYSWKALSTWGTVEQFKYLLPRLFELISTESWPDCPQVLFLKPRRGGFVSWPDDEREAVLQFCEALWLQSLSHHPVMDTIPAFPSISDCLCSIAQIVDDLRPMLQAWEHDRSYTATMNLLGFADENASTLREQRRLTDAFWGDRAEQMQQVADWFLNQDFALIFDIVPIDIPAWEFRDELRRSIEKARSAL